MDHHANRRHLARHLARFAAVVAQGDLSLDGTSPDRALGLDNAVADELVTSQLRRLLAANRALARRACRVRLPVAPGDRSRALRDVEVSLHCALRADPAAADALWALLTPIASGAGEATDDVVSRRRDVLQWVFGRHAVVGMLLTGAIAAVVLVGVAAEDFQLGSLSPLELGVIWILSFLPGWLYIRFIGQRAGAIWDEFVLNLHRLRLDEPQHLPQPPVNSTYYRDWFDGGGAALSRHRNIYRQKFEAYYGRCVSAANSDARLKAGTFFPVVLATVIFAIGWTAILWNEALLNGTETVHGVLAFGFLGAYLFDIQMLTRRFFQSDLKPSAYASAALRVVVVLILVIAMHQLPFFDGEPSGTELVVAFVLGLFPLVGLQALNAFVAKVLKSRVPSLESAYPLSDLEGLNVWYEARLMEEGIEDMQNLVSANMVDVLLHTRVPVGRLVDWCDQAQLFVHLSPRPRPDDDAFKQHPRTVLSRFGVRSATTFLKAFADGALDKQGEARDPLVRHALERLEHDAPELSPPAVMMIARVLNGSPALRPIQSWRALEAAPPPRSERLDDADSSTVVELDAEARRRAVDDDVA
jgi:hypothetical protein